VLWVLLDSVRIRNDIRKVLLKVKPGLGEGYDWVECGACGAGWQVSHFESVM
jgi:hypothetical protein